MPPKLHQMNIKELKMDCFLYKNTFLSFTAQLGETVSLESVDTNNDRRISCLTVTRCSTSVNDIEPFMFHLFMLHAQLYTKRWQEALRSAMVRDLCSAILCLKDINHMKSTGSPLLQRPLFYSLSTEVISRAAAIVCIIELLTLPDKMHRESASLQAVNKMRE